MAPATRQEGLDKAAAPKTKPRKQPTMATLIAVWSSDAYAARVRQLENEGLTTSDAQSVADAEYNLVAKGG